ncbi:threonine/serine exporter family protein [Clostridium sp. Cult2]|uniref:threonine/serine exporter family protein n=1 Tax=Clostridium sp. Cult2 TaxID=2079003 RepID=UPI001F1FCFEC|nr:threonine/serine exporter [Clostridium sp. Cult2]
MTLIKHFIYAFLCSVGFAVFFSIPKDSIFRSGCVGAIGQIAFYITSNIFNSDVTGTFFGAITVGMFGELFARHYKKPATVFLVPGIVPLVPGAGMYYTMLALVEKDFISAANKGIETFFIAAAISIGLIISTSLSRSIKRVKSKN